MTTYAPTLLELQRAVRSDLLGLADGGAADYVIPEGLTPQARLAIYRNTANSTLLKALQLSYPAVQALVGEEFFEGAARLFIGQCPPSHAQLDSYGATFPDFLAQMPEAVSLDYLPDTARLEWAVTEVLHAPDARPLDLPRLGQLNDDGLKSVRFVPNPVVRLLQSAYPVDVIWRAVLTRDDGALAAIRLSAGPVWLHVFRSTAGVEVRQIAEWQWRFATALFAGCPLQDVLPEAPHGEAHRWLASLLASGCFIDVCTSNDACGPTTGSQFT
ncbi:putative DNA-binding protein [Paraburkholderia sp. BL23I1N1]|uniref:HvfC/BufC N-terminal domain-containing protein n=1 Tax=Paraburkholderia sp. BL23I1N1 TaxID=1938802 RepID=UPI000E757701|nr:DNA-binding domain-containing protein [Paraburkholderia sp. BL23I1N1]RKE25217.1 putative DNA-binding protein [Paraburkholderia sp. BL23I1N1]